MGMAMGSKVVWDAVSILLTPALFPVGQCVFLETPGATRSVRPSGLCGGWGPEAFFSSFPSDVLH